MSVVVESFSVAGYTVSAGPYTIAVPAGVVDGELLLWFVDFEDETSGPLAGPTIITPAGWAKFGGNDNYGNYHSWAGFARIASSEPSSYAVTIAVPEGNDCGMVMLRLSGFDPMAAIPHAFANTNEPIPGSPNISAPSVVTTVDGCAIFRVCGPARATAPAAPSGTTSVASVNVSFGASLQAARDNSDLTPAGASGTVLFITDGLGSEHALTLAIAPLVSGHGGAAGSSPAVLAQAGRERIQRAVAMHRRDFWEEMRR